MWIKIALFSVMMTVAGNATAADPCNPGRIEKPDGKSPSPPKDEKPPYNPKF